MLCVRASQERRTRQDGNELSQASGLHVAALQVFVRPQQLPAHKPRAALFLAKSNPEACVFFANVAVAAAVSIFSSFTSPLGCASFSSAPLLPFYRLQAGTRASIQPAAGTITCFVSCSRLQDSGRSERDPVLVQLELVVAIGQRLRPTELFYPPVRAGGHVRGPCLLAHFVSPLHCRWLTDGGHCAAARRTFRASQPHLLSVVSELRGRT